MNNTKQIIYNSAKELFSLYGYKKVSMDELARNANVTKKTVYSYFDDKEALLKFIVREEIENMKLIIEKYEKDDSLTYLEKVIKTLYELLKRKKEDKLFIMLSKESEEINSISTKMSLKEVDDSIVEFIKERVSYAIDKNLVKECDVDLCSFIIYKIFVSVMVEYDKSINEKEVTMHVKRILKDGLFN